MNIRLCLDNTPFNSKPNDITTAFISNKIAGNELNININELAEIVGNRGCTFTPVTFHNKKRINHNFKSQQIFALDFDGGVSFEEISNRAIEYRIPIAFSYKTLSATDKLEKFRVVFCHYSEITDTRVSKFIQKTLMEIFYECDKACSDQARMFFGGKGLITGPNNTTFNINDLSLSLSRFYYNNHDSNHYKDFIKEFALRLGVQLNKGFIKIEIDENYTQPTNNIACVQLSPNEYGSLYFEEERGASGLTPPQGRKKSERRKLERRFHFGKLSDCCKLYHEFSTGSKWLYHNELFGIATNLCNIEGGYTLFESILNSEENSQYESYHNTDWNFYTNYITKNEYKAQFCDCFCPYKDDCQHSTTIISTTKTPRYKVETTGKEAFVPLKEAEASLQENFINTLNANDNKIHIIKAQTGLGKSHTYLKYLDSGDKPYIVAVPSTDLKIEIYEKARERGYNVMMTPTIPSNLPTDILDKIDKFYKCGAKKQVSKYIKSLITSEDNVYSDLEIYLEELEKVYNFDGHIITTHARFLSMQPSMLKSYNIIIDEDIIKSLMPIDSVYFDDIQKILDNENMPTVIKERLKYLKKIEDCEYMKKRQTTMNFSDAEIENLLNNSNFSSNIVDFLSATAVHIDNNKKIISYINQKELPNQKIILLSATANTDLYKILYGENRVKAYDTKKARYMGHLIQYTRASCSRGYFERNPDSIPEIEIIVDDIGVITFKNYRSFFKNSLEAYFGKVEGFNGYEGKDLAVVGTPHTVETTYKLYGILLGANVQDQTIATREVNHNSYKFYFPTYSDPILQKIQLWIIESELEQAIGRARLLRYDCTVYLFSNLPLSQAEFVFDAVI